MVSGELAHLGVVFGAHAEWLEHAGCAELRARGLLDRLSDEELLREAAALLQAWAAFFGHREREGAWAHVRAAVQRRLLAGWTVEEVVGAFLAFRDVVQRQIPSRVDECGDGNVRAVYDRLSQRLVAQVAAECAALREELLRQRMRALIEAGMSLAGQDSLDEVLQKIVDLARDVFGARYAALGVMDEHGGLARFVASGMDQETQARIRSLPAGRGVLGIALHHPIRSANLREDPRSVGFPPEHPVMRSFLGVPVASRARTYGSLYLAEKHDGEPFSAEDEALASTFASQAAVAIERARSLESQRRERQHAELLQRVIAAQEDERKRVARELHDHTGQSLTSLLLGLRRLESAQTLEQARADIEQMRHSTARALEELHQLAFELRPSALDDLGLQVALHRYADDFAKRTGITLEVQLEALSGVRLEPAAEIAVYRIVQEALTNVAKHARARTASILAQSRAGSLRLIIEDDGCGFVVPDPQDVTGKHFGLIGMHERVALIGGRLTIESSPGRGTTVYVELPK